MERQGLKSIGVKYLIGETNLKKDLLYFDKIVYDINELKFAEMFVNLVGEKKLGSSFDQIYSFQKNELDYLQENNLLESFDSNKFKKIVCQEENSEFKKYYDQNPGTGLFSYNDVIHMGSVFEEVSHFTLGTPEKKTVFKNYFFSILYNKVAKQDVVPILDNFISENQADLGRDYKILEVVLNKMPIINDTVSWEQIINFKNDPDSKRKFLALRNWMIDISKGDYNSKELHEKYDFLKAEYDAHMKRHKISTTFGTIKTFAITTSEILEDLVKLNWSNAIKTGFEIFEKNSKLSEIEANAPGKEVGYVYDIESKFKKS
jgi:hypothetical protein